MRTHVLPAVLFLLVPSAVAAGGEAERILEAAAAATASVQSLTARFEYQPDDPEHAIRGSIRLARPNRVLVDLPWSSPAFTSRPGVVACDGTTMRMVNQHRTSYREMPPSLKQAHVNIGIVDFLINPTVGRLTRGNALRDAGTQTLDGVEYRVVEMVHAEPVFKGTTRLFVGPDDLIHRSEHEGRAYSINRGPEGRTERHFDIRTVTVLKDLIVDPPLSASDFAYTPPQEAQLVVSGAAEQRMLAVGTPAPDFTLATFDGGEVTLSALAREHKAVILNFWFVGCTGCRQELPHLDAMARERGVDGLTVLAVNVNDSHDLVSRFLEGGTPAYRIAMTDPESTREIRRAYGLHGYPANYVIDAHGIVRCRVAGPDLKAIRSAVDGMLAENPRMPPE